MIKMFTSSSAYDGAPGYKDRSKQSVTVVRPLTPEECDVESGPMFLVRFSDGVETSVFEDELS